MTFSRRTDLLSSIIGQRAHSYSAVEQQRDVFESHRHHVFSVAYYMTGSEQEAEDILSSTFIRTFQRDAQPSVGELDRTLMEELNRRLSLAPVAPMHPNGEALQRGNVRRTDLEEALWQLPARERLCFLLRDVEGYDATRIAGLLKCPEADIRHTLFSARLRLRSLLVEQQATATA